MKHISMKALTPLALAIALTGCEVSLTGDATDNMDMMEPTSEPMMDYMYEYQITVTNLTNAQPLSPILASINGGGMPFWQAGEPASMSLEYLAEGGDHSMLLADVMNDSQSYGYAAGSAPVMPGMSEQLTVSFDSDMMVDAHLSLASMLVNTNDAFTGVPAYSLMDLAAGDSMNMYFKAYDAGTEMNSETAATIPGPAGLMEGGEGTNMARDDVNFVYIHPGVISKDDGLAGSALSADHRFDNPVVMLTVKRVK